MSAALAPTERAGILRELGWIDPLAAFACFAGDPYVAFLESGGAPGERARYSYLCIDPVLVLRNVSLAALADELARWRVVRPEMPVPFLGGAVGFCGYELGASLEAVPRAPGGLDGLPDMQFGIYDIVLAWDMRERRAWLAYASAGSWKRAEAALARVRAATAPHVPAVGLRWTACVSRRTHMARVERVLEFIRAGDIYQANIAARFSAVRPAGVSGADVFLALRAGNPAPFTAFIDCGADCAVASVSPERFLRVSAAGAIEARPIKGTRPRGLCPAEDEAAAADLRASSKDHAENLMIVDLLRNDISRVAVPGSVRVPALAVLESFASVHHLVSVVHGRLRPDRRAIDLLRAAFPGGSITGAPKLRAMEIIAELEGVARGPYCGAAAWIGFDGAMDSSILIRTVSVGQTEIVAQAGGGIVADSAPAAEWDEALVKIRPVLAALGAIY
jgi:para-aminobenzoate synthetase component 1